MGIKIWRLVIVGGLCAFTFSGCGGKGNVETKQETNFVVGEETYPPESMHGMLKPAESQKHKIILPSALHDMDETVENNGGELKINSIQFTDKMSDLPEGTYFEEERIDWLKSDGAIDENNNCIEPVTYLIVSACLRNPTDREQTYLLNDFAIFSYDKENYYLNQMTNELSYSDVLQTQEKQSEKYHYTMAPGESQEFTWIYCITFGMKEVLKGDSQLVLDVNNRGAYAEEGDNNSIGSMAYIKLDSGDEMNETSD